MGRIQCGDVLLTFCERKIEIGQELSMLLNKQTRWGKLGQKSWKCPNFPHLMKMSETSVGSSIYHGGLKFENENSKFPS